MPGTHPAPPGKSSVRPANEVDRAATREGGCQRAAGKVELPVAGVRKFKPLPRGCGRGGRREPARPPLWRWEQRATLESQGLGKGPGAAKGNARAGAGQAPATGGGREPGGLRSGLKGREGRPGRGRGRGGGEGARAGDRPHGGVLWGGQAPLQDPGKRPGWAPCAHGETGHRDGRG